MNVGVTAGMRTHAQVLPHPSRPDWFAVPKSWGPDCGGAPQVQLDRHYGTIVHRSHLPLLIAAHPEIAIHLGAHNVGAAAVAVQDVTARAAFDATTAPNGWTLRGYQHDGRDFIRARRGTLLGDAMRVGKGNVHGTPVLTPTGWRPIEDLAVGDQVIGSNGQPCNVTGVFPRGEIPVFRVTFSDRTSTIVDGEHKWAAWTHTNFHRGNHSYEVVDTAHLRATVKQQWRIPLVEPIAFPERELPLDPYLLGVLLGDGSLSQSGVVFTPGDEAVPVEVAKVLPAGVCLTRGGDSCKPTSVPWSLTGTVRGRGTNPVITALCGLGLKGKRAWEKYVPEAYLFASPAQRLALLQGLMDTDGELSALRRGKPARRLQFSSAAEALVLAVKFLVESLGGSVRRGYRAAPTYTYKGERLTGRPSWRLSIAMPPGVNPFRARQGWAPRTKYHPARVIRSVEPEGTAPVTCISVDAPDQLYVVEHCIVTHNTAQIIASHDPELGPLMVVAPLATREVWLAWFKRRWPAERPVVLDGRTLVHDHGKKPLKPRKDPGFDLMSGDRFDAARLRAAKLIFCHYDILGAWKDLGGNLIGTIVFDEIHIASQRASRRAQAVMYAANRAARVIGATGTPIWNRPAGLYTTLQAIAPGAFGTFFDYAMRYCDAQPGPHGYIYSGSSNEIEFKARMAEIMIRRTWQDVSGELPPIERSVEVVPITPKQQFEIEKQAERVRDHGKQTTAVGALARFRRLLAGIKVDAAADVAQRVLDSGEKVVVWAWHHEIAVQLERALAAGGHPGFVISGRTSQGVREEILNRWRALATPAPLCITLAVGQVGIDLSAARQEVFAELDFTPSIVAQAEMRVFSPARPMSASYVIVDHDIDRKILAALQNKCDVAYRMGVPAAESTIGVLATAFAQAADGPDDFDALARAIATAHPDLDDLDDSSHFHGSLWTYDWEEP